LADKGGVLGIYDLPYLAPSPKQPSVDDYMAHMEHALKVIGEDHVGVGSDASLAPSTQALRGWRSSISLKSSGKSPGWLRRKKIARLP
jgi:membrane dipeptidase